MLHRGRVIETSPASSRYTNTPQTGEAQTFIAGDLLSSNEPVEEDMR